MYNFDFKKSLGQNFLKDDNVVNNIVNAVNFKENNLVIEIGPGSGMLSGRLLEKVDFAILYEIDTRLEKILDKELEMYDNYEIIFDDFLKRNVKNDLKKYNYNNLYMVANLPYYVTTPIISKIIDDDIPMNEIVIMIQKEVADRLTADVGTKEYGQITVFLNYFFNIEKMFNVSKNCFVPKPRVDSAVIKMTRKNTREKLKDISFFIFRRIPIYDTFGQTRISTINIKAFSHYHFITSLNNLFISLFILAISFDNVSAEISSIGLLLKYFSGNMLT